MTENRPAGRSIWTRPERPGRGPVPEHSRTEIASAGIALADAAGLGTVTMRNVAAAIGTGPSSLYRYVANRAELLDLMADQARGELTYDGANSGEPTARLLAIAREGHALYLRHPWLLDIPAARIPGPNAIAFTEQCLAALSGADLSGSAKLETIGLFSGAVRLLAQTEMEQRRAGQDITQWQSELAAHLSQIAAAGHNPHLAAALTDTPPVETAGQQDSLFERAMIRILAGLLPARLSRSREAPGICSPVGGGHNWAEAERRLVATRLHRMPRAAPITFKRGAVKPAAPLLSWDPFLAATRNTGAVHLFGACSIPGHPG